MAWWSTNRPAPHSSYDDRTSCNMSSVTPRTQALTIWTAIEHGSPFPKKNTVIEVMEKYDGGEDKKRNSRMDRGQVKMVPKWPSTRGRSRGMVDLKMKRYGLNHQGV